MRKASAFPLLFFAGACILYALCDAEAVGASIRRALLLFGQKVLPSLFLFSVSVKLFLGTGIFSRLDKTPMRHLFSVLGVSAAGFAAWLMGLFAGFPVGAAALSDGVQSGALNKREAARLLPFANHAGAGFVVGAGVAVFGSARIGFMLYLAGVAASLLGVVLTAGETPEKGAAMPCEEGRSPAGLITRAVSESALSMVSVCGYILFFSVISAMISTVFARFLPFSEDVLAIFSGFLELSGGLFGLSAVNLGTFSKLILFGGLLGFGGISVFFQAADHAERAGISLSFYWAGRMLMTVFSGMLAPLFVFLSEKRGGGFSVFVIFVLIFFVGWVKNKIFFKKTMEKRNGMLYNRNEIHCP